MDAFKHGDYEVAFREALKGAQEGNIAEQNNVAVFYASGTGVAQNYREACKWWKRAADQGMVSAQASLGVTYLNGARGVPRDRDQAAFYLLKAADQGGDASAQYNLGRMYMAFGEGVPHDPSLAHEWLGRAVASYQRQIDAGWQMERYGRDAVAARRKESARPPPGIGADSRRRAGDQAF